LKGHTIGRVRNALFFGCCVFQLKICGVCHAADITAIAAAGADAVGLNFYPQSKRFLTEREAEEIAGALPSGLARVGVFVNASSAVMLATAQRYNLDFLQLHGDEPPEQLTELRAWPVIKAFRFGPDGWRSIQSYLMACKQHGALPVAVLADAPAASGEFGGTGRTADWTALSEWRSHIDQPLILAGGLNPNNIVRAIELVRPSAVDTAGGVEQSARRKSEGATRQFVSRAREALAKVAPH
jgi:phosphoribosylanthranilate isomerase